jgi:uncharacterized repeat protein (TIGR01451 family)
MKRPLRPLLALLPLVTVGSLAGQDQGEVTASRPGPVRVGPPIELRMKRAASTTMDLRLLPQTPPRKRERPEREAPEVTRVELPGGPTRSAAVTPGPSAPAPSPIANFLGLDFANWGAGHPPDTNGDVGPTYYIETINTSIGIYAKSGGPPVAAFTFDTFMSQGSFGNLCDTDNFGDPVVLYDSFEDRWVITDFAFQLDGANNVINPPGAFQCFAVSKTGDPVTGGWNYFSLHLTDALNDYPKFGIWPDGIYMSANMFGFPATGSFEGTRVWALNKAQMYAGEPTIQVVQFNPPVDEFTLLPANARLQAGTPPAGSPNYFTVVWNFSNAVSVYKFHVDWNSISTSTFTGPFIAITPTSFADPPGTVPSQGGNNLDTLAVRLMMQNQYTNLGGVESLWNVHTVAGSSASQSAVRFYQTTVTGGTVAAGTTQAATHNPDATNRFMPSLAVDRAGNMALGYSTSSSSLFPAIKYAGNLATDPLDTISQTEVSLINGTGTQLGNCGGTCTRWGDYSAMSLDPDGCTFWYTNEYYATSGLNYLTRIGSFKFPSCTPVTSGTVQGTVTATVGGAPIGGATIKLGSRSTTTNGSGFYQFLSIPAGTYPGITASAPGYNSSTVTSVLVAGATTTKDFSLSTAPTTGCPTDSSQADFQTGLPTNVDLTTSPGAVILASGPNIDQQNTTLGNFGVGITITTWGGQTFIPAVTGQLTRADINLFCSGCSGTTPDLTLSLRATSGGLPTGADIASATIAGFSSGAGGFYTANFAIPPTLTAGTQYALVIRPAANPSPGTYALTRSGGSVGADVYANGTRVSGATSGTVWSIPTMGGVTTDAGFKTYVNGGFASSGDLVSSIKDSNPPIGFTPTWSTLSWTATTPANTSLKFQVAPSNSAAGPFTFVGPDDTPATFFTTSGASLSQFNGNRYLKYKAYLSTTDSAASPTLNDVALCFTDTAPPVPDLSITKSDGGASVAPGGTVAYTLTYANGGGQGATGVVLSETVPANTTFNPGASTAGWVCSPNNNAGSACTLAIGAVAAASGPLTATFAVTVVNPVAAGVTQISNTATVADDGTQGADPTPGNNSGSDTSPVTGAPDLSITKSDGGASVAAGGTVAYTLTYANAGNRGASGVVLSETVPANTTFNAGASTAGWVCSPNNNAGSTCTLAVGGLAAGGGNQSATFAATVVTPLPGGVTQISNTASIADDGTNGTDPTLGNNSGSDTTPVTAVPDLSMTKSDGGVSALPGGTVAYVLTYLNSGSIGATGVVIGETVPANTTFNAGASTAGWVCTPNNSAGSACTRTVGSLAAGSGNQTATFAVTVGNPLPGGVTAINNTATIADDGANGADPTPANNSASDTTPVLDGLYYTLVPCRLLDTRNPNGPYGGPALNALSTRTFVAAGQCGVPAGAKALSFNITVAQATAQGNLRVYPAGVTPPLVSVINYLADQNRANNGVVALGAAGDFVVESGQTTGTVHVIVDVNGYFQ